MWFPVVFTLSINRPVTPQSCPFLNPDAGSDIKKVAHTAERLAALSYRPHQAAQAAACPGKGDLLTPPRMSGPSKGTFATAITDSLTQHFNASGITQC